MNFKRLLAAFILVFGFSAISFAGGFGFNVNYNQFQSSNDVGDFDFLDDGDFGLGARGEFGGNLALVLSFDYYFPDDDIGDLNFYELNANLIYNIPTESVRPYFGGGAGISRVSFDSDFFEDDATEVGFNVLGGLKFGTGGINPFIEARYVIYPDDETFNNRFVISGGIIF